LLLEINEKFRKVSGVSSLAAIARSILRREHIFDQQKEHFLAVGLNTQNEVQYVDLVSLGTLDASLVHPRECFRHAVANGVSSIAFIHNHPSGDITPSREDQVVTERLISAGEIIGIEVLDHVIVSDSSTYHFSFREERFGLWPR